eukprot:1157844-Pelagomonas_calceolata.AAC.3
MIQFIGHEVARVAQSFILSGLTAVDCSEHKGDYAPRVLRPNNNNNNNNEGSFHMASGCKLQQQQ